MPKCNLFHFNVFVNDRPLKEYAMGSEFYVESDLHSDASYYIEEGDAEENTQRYPVTPFTVKGSLHNLYDFPLYLRLRVDGQQIWMKPFPPRCKQSFKVNGYKYEHVIRELLFTLPRIEESVSPKKKRQKSGNEERNMEGTISMECIEAKECGTFTTQRTSFKASHSAELSHRPGLYQSSKKYGSGNVGVSTREGRTLFNCAPERGSMKTMVKYQIGKHHFQGVVMKYRPRYMLQELGITDEAWNSVTNTRRMTNEQKNSGDTNVNLQPEKVENITNENTDPNTNGTLDFTEKFRKMNCNSPSEQSETTVDEKSQIINADYGRLFCLSPRAKQKMTVDSPSALKTLVNSPADLQKMNVFSPSDKNKIGKTDVNSPSELLKNPYKSRVKMENQDDEHRQYRMIEIDDDIQILEEVDDDVIWMGDDSCCFLDVTDPDISMVDLSEDI
ncbi:uncharacterized protein LOC117323025 [Pecten maximus]|uniref:uncharacterized protein LOC117323025 n=1 Tax=Pecten maximus TaxID=6579 RepID=UPI001458380E|nr:uncharacterized protein LOC117323025 [Pecten maximus]